jgi:signal transduction histidine kinase
LLDRQAGTHFFIPSKGGNNNVKSEVLESNVDITERKRAEEALKEAKQQAELYLDLMGHDISNMHQIALGQLELARETMETFGRLEGEDKQMIDVPVEILWKSARLINNIRNIQMMRAGEYKFERLDLGDVLTEAVREYSHIPGRDIRIDYNPVHSCPVKANQLLKDIFNNLLDNAVKHCNDPIRIGVGVLPVVENGRHFYRVAVEDNGSGILDERKDEIFNRLSRGDTKARGTGLGLYIVKTLVDGFGGRVWAEDRVPGDPTQGTRFVVYLPVMESEHPE